MYNNDNNPKSNRNFKMLLVNSGFSRFGFSTFDLVIIWVVLYITHSPFLSGLADGMMAFPLFLSFVVGAYVDKISRKKNLAIVASFFRAISMLLIFIGIFFGNQLIVIIAIFISAFLIGFTSDILNSIRASWTKEFLSESQYKYGSSSQNTVNSLAEGIGYIASGFLIQMGFSGAFLALFVVFLLSVTPIIFIINAETTVENVEENISSTIIEGMNFVKKNRAIVQIMIIAIIVNFIFGMAGIIFIALVQVHFKLPPIYVSLIFVSLLIGIIGGSSFARILSGRVGPITLVNLVTVGFSLVSIYFIRAIMIVILPTLIIGFSIGITNVVVGTALLKIIPSDMMARIQGTFNTFSVAIVSVSGMIGGLIIQAFGYGGSFVILGIGIIIISPLPILFKKMGNLTI